MQSKQDIEKIMDRFQNLKEMDENYVAKKKQDSKAKLLDLVGEIIIKHPFLEEEEKQQVPEKNKKKQEIYTKTTIARQIAKLKPYLNIEKIQPTTDEMEDIKNQEYVGENYKRLSQLIILENKKLCKILEQNEKYQSKTDELERMQKDKQGWIFQVFYRSVRDSSEDITKKGFICVYAVFTEILQIFTSLTFSNKLMTILVTEINHVGYLEEMNYEIIEITLQKTLVHFGFLNSEKFNLFDRFLFLQKNMAKSTSTRLFQNQLIKNIYAQF